MSTIPVPRPDVTGDEVARALSAALGPDYQVAAGVRMPRLPFKNPQPGSPDLIMVSHDHSSVVRAQIAISRQAGHSELQITACGVGGNGLLNKFGIARHVHAVLADAPNLR